MSGQVQNLVASLARDSTHRLVAALARRLGAGRIPIAEDAVQHALLQALSLWPFKGVPERPEAWLATVARNRALDLLRGEARRAALAEDLLPLAQPTADNDGRFDRELNDDELALLFAVCHPALSPEMRVTFALKTVCGLTVPQIAAGLLGEPAAIAQRLVRARRQLEAADVAIEPPPPEALPERAETVRTALYLVFNEGYSASSGESLTRADLSGEAIRLGRLLVELLPEPEAMGLLALMLLHESRRAARTGPTGELVLLDDQDRSRWSREQIAEGTALVERALGSRRIGPYTLQAAISAVHAEASTAAATDWAQIVGLYDVLVRADPSPVIELNRAVAVAMRDGPAAGLALIDAILARGALADYHLAHSARAELCRRLGRTTDARAAYERALGLARQEPQRRFLERRLSELLD